MKLIVVTRCCLLLAVLAVATISCSKSGSTPKNLVGTWNEPANPGGYGHSVSFGADGSFNAIFISYPRPDATGGVTVQQTTILRGNFTVKRDSLLTKVSTMSVQEGSGTPVVTASTQKVFEYATFKVNNNELTINYTTYPADAPVPTQRVYTRESSN